MSLAGSNFPTCVSLFETNPNCVSVGVNSSYLTELTLFQLGLNEKDALKSGIHVVYIWMDISLARADSSTIVSFR